MPQPINYSDSTPAAPAGEVNNKWQADTPAGDNVTRNVSTYTPLATATTPGAVPTPPNDVTKVLRGDATWGGVPQTDLANDADVDITSPSDGDVLTYVAAASKWENKSVSSGLDLQTNGSDNGSQVKLNLIAGSNVTITDGGTGGVTIAASGGGGGGGATLPALSDFTWVNQGSSTAVQRVPDGPILSAIEDASGLEWRGLFKSVPGSTPYKVQAQLRGLVAGYTNSQTVGLYFYDGTKLMGFEFLIQSSGVLPRVERINSVTSDNGTAATYSSQSQVQMLNSYMSPVWVQLRNDGTDLYFDYSLDGANFINLWSEAVGSFITPTQYGFGGISVTSGAQPSVICDLLAWVETNNATL